MRISDWSSDVCSSDLRPETGALVLHPGLKRIEPARGLSQYQKRGRARCAHSRHGARPEKKPLRRLDLPEPCGSRSMAQQTRSAVFIVADIKKRRPSVNPTIDYYFTPQRPWTYLGHEIGRASCRERVFQYV